MINIAVCDDNIETTSEIEDLITKVEKTNDNQIDVYFCGESILEAISTGTKYDIIYLDIEMKGLDGIDTAHKIREYDKSAFIIYITSHVKLAPQAFEVNAYRFMKKPIDAEKFDAYYLSALKEIIKTPKYFEFQFKRENHRVAISDIMYFESEKRVTYIRTSTGLDIQYYEKMNDIEKRINALKFEFYRTNQSFLVNPDYVYSYMFNQIILKNGTTLIISENRRKKVNELFCKIKGGEIIV